MSLVRSSSWRFLRRWWLVLAAGAFALLASAVVSLGLFIIADAHDKGRAAQREFEGDEVQALMALVQSERHSLSERNQAVWALGQLRDARALSVLEKYYYGGPCNHARFICQRELEKAIDGCRHRSMSAPAFFAKLLGLGT